MPLWSPADLSSKFLAGYRLKDTSGGNVGAEVTQIGGSVSQWDDWSGNGRHVTQATAANQPAYSATALDGVNPGIDFDGADGLRNTSFGVTAGTEIDVYAVFKFGASENNYARVISFAAASGNDYDTTGYIPILRNANFAQVATYGAGNFRSTASLALDTPAVVGTHTGGETAYVNGSAGSTSSFTFASGALPRFGIGCRSDGTFGDGDNTNGVIAEVVVVTGLTTAERQLVEGYLAHKWDLEGSLPADHSYKSAAPETGGGGGSTQPPRTMHQFRMRRAA
jgi:hypothetical protein